MLFCQYHAVTQFNVGLVERQRVPLNQCFCNFTICRTGFLLLFNKLLIIDVIWEVTLTSPPLSIITGNSRKSLERGGPLTHRSGTIVILHDFDMKLIILVCCLLGLSLANEEGDDLHVASTEVCIIFAFI